MKSTIVIPNYNGMKYIQKCLESVEKNVTCEIIIVDNASTDGSREWITSHFPHIKLICNEQNEGFCKAVNQGILEATTEYVILLNNDTEVDVHFVEELERVLDNNPGLFSASAKMIALHEQDKMDDAGDFYCALGWAFARGKGKHPSCYEKNYPVFASCGGAAIYRREVFDEIGLFDENHFAYLEDMDIGYRAKIYGYQNMFAADAIVYHAGSATSGSRYNAFKTRLASRNSVYLVHKNMPLLQLFINLPLLLLGYLVKTLFFIKKGMGKEYVTGVMNGWKLAFSKEGRAHKVPFTRKHCGNYFKIQLELWINIFRLAGW